MCFLQTATETMYNLVEIEMLTSTEASLRALKVRASIIPVVRSAGCNMPMSVYMFMIWRCCMHSTARGCEPLTHQTKSTMA